MVDELKGLPPEERIKKLRELEAKKKKEIEEAARLIRESEDELTDRRAWEEKVPIPEVAQEELTGLSVGAKDILKVQGRVQEKQEVVEDPEETKEAVEKEERSLEDTVEAEVVSKSNELQNVQYGFPQDLAHPQANAEYAMRLSYMPAEELRDRVEAVRASVQDRGYMTHEEQNFVMAAYAASENKERAVQEGKYSMIEEAAQATSLIAQTTGRLLDQAYHARQEEHRTQYQR